MGAPLSSWPVCLACLGLFPKVVKHLMTKRIIFGDSLIRLKSLVAKYHVVLNGCASQYGPGVELKLRIFIRSVLTSPGRWQTLDNLQLWTQPIAHFTHCPLSCTLCVNFRAEFITTNTYVHCEHGSAIHCTMAAYIGKRVGLLRFYSFHKFLDGEVTVRKVAINNYTTPDSSSFCCWCDGDSSQSSSLSSSVRWGFIFQPGARWLAGGLDGITTEGVQSIRL